MLISQLSQYRILADAVKLHEENFRLQTHDYRLGQVTNLEVLTALSDLYTTKDNVEIARFQSHVAAAALQVARGRVPEPRE